MHWINLEKLWVLVVIAGVFIFVNTQPIRPHDFWWHLSLGREISTTGNIPGIDVYSFIMQGTPYPSYNMFWLVDLTLFSIYNLGGAALVIFVQSLIITAAYGLLLWLCWMQSNSTRIAAFSVILAIALGINNWNIRPQTISYLLGALTLVGIYSYRRTGRISWLSIPPVAMLVWVNSHGSFVIGLMMIGIWVADEFWKIALDFYHNQKRTYTELLTSITVLGLTCIVCLANPRGIGIVTYVRSLTGNTTVVNLVTEWAPPNFNSVQGLIFFGIFMLVSIVLAISPKRPNFLQILTYVIFGFLALRTTRGVVWFGIVSAPILANHLAALVKVYLPGNDKTKDRYGNRIINLILLIAIMAAVLISLPWFKHSLPFPSSKAGWISSETPVDATEFLLTEQLPRDLFHDMGFGSYLIWAAYPNYQVFTDPRIELYPIETWWDYTSLGNALPGWEDLLDKYEIKTLMLSPVNQPNLIDAIEDSPSWVAVYQDSKPVIYTKINH